jgi:hypothetical protein
MTDDPDKYRSDMRKKLLELANSMPLAPMAAARDKKVRGLASLTESESRILRAWNR